MITPQTNYQNVARSQNTSAGNGNLSSLLSQIQDDGPAYGDAPTPDNLVNLRKNNIDNYSNNQQSDYFSQTSQTSQTGQANVNPEISAKTKTSNAKTKSTTTIQTLLILFVALAVTFFLFRLDSRTDHLEAALTSHDEIVQDSIDSYTEEISPSFIKINKTLGIVKKELELIKANTVDEVTEEIVPVEEQSLPEQEVVAKEDSSIVETRTLEEEILSLKSKLQIVNEKLNAIDGKNTTNKSKTSNEIFISPARWVVNLASLTNKNKADTLVEQLGSTGLAPSLQQAEVNGKLVYRLIVGGFTSHDDAQAFIQHAGEQYGLSGGWVRKI